MHDPVDVVRRWSAGVASESIHVLTMPPPGSDANELWVRFAGIIGTDPSAATEFDVAAQRFARHGRGRSACGASTSCCLSHSPAGTTPGLARDVLASQILGPRSALRATATSANALVDQVLTQSDGQHVRPEGNRLRHRGRPQCP